MVVERPEIAPGAYTVLTQAQPTQCLLFTASTQLIKNKDIFLARPRRFELLTPRFVVWCSIQLSYGRIRAGLAPPTGANTYTGARANARP